MGSSVLAVVLSGGIHLDPIDIVIIVGFLVLFMGIGISQAKKSGKNLTSYFLGGRNLPWYIAGISMVATTFAADTPLAVAELVGKDGIAGNWVWWNFLLGGMLTTFFFSRLWRRANVLTEVELIEIRYSGKPARFLRGFKAVYLGLFMNVMIIGWVNFALISLLKGFFGLSGNEALMYTALAMVAVAIYSSLSGLTGVAYTDVVQFIVAMTGCIILAILVVNSSEIGGIEGLKEKLSGEKAGALQFFPSFGSGTSSTGYMLTIGIGAFLARIGMQWWSSWYPGAEPGGGGYIAQRMMSTPREKDAVYSTLLFQIAHYCLRPWPWIIVGLCAIVLYPDLGADEKQMGYVYAMRDFLPAGLKGLLIVAFFAAYMSTISTQLNWGASYLVNDLYARFIRKKEGFIDKEAAGRHYVAAGKITTVFLMIVALGVTTQIKSIASIWDFIFQCGAGLGLVLIVRWYWWRVNAWAEIVASIVPFAGYTLSEFVLHLDFASSMLFTVLLTTVCWLIIAYSTPPTERKTLEAFYAQVKPLGAWKKFSSTEDQTKGHAEMKYLFFAWIFAILFTYGILFLSGKIILHEWNEAIIYALVVIASFAGLRVFVRKSGIFE